MSVIFGHSSRLPIGVERDHQAANQLRKSLRVAFFLLFQDSRFQNCKVLVLDVSRKAKVAVLTRETTKTTLKSASRILDFYLRKDPVKF